MTADRLPTRTVALYAMLGAPLTALTLPLVVYLPPFYAEVGGLSLGAVGVAFMAARLWDIATDPIVGALQDQTRVTFGRRKAWIGAGVPLLLLAIWLVFNPPENAGLSYLYVCLFFLYVGFTMAQVGHFSWGAEIAREYHERSRVHGWREACAVFGMLSVLIVPAAVQTLGLGGPGDDVRAMGWFLLIVLPLVALATLTLVPEPPPPPRQPLGLKKAAAAIARNKAMRLALVAEFLSGFAPGVTGALFIFFFRSVVEVGDLANLLLLVYFVAALVGVPLWIQASYRLGKHRTLVAAVMVQAVALLLIVFLPKGEPLIAAAAMAIAGLPANAPPFILRAMVTDAVDADRIETGEQRTGVYFGLMLLMAKAALALAPGVTYLALEAVRFDPALGPQNTPQALSTLIWLFIGAPVAANALLALVVWNFPIDQARQAAMRVMIDAPERPPA